MQKIYKALLIRQSKQTTGFFKRKKANKISSNRVTPVYKAPQQV